MNQFSSKFSKATLAVAISSILYGNSFAAEPSTTAKKTGNFTLNTAVNLSVMHDSNIFASRDNEKNDTVFILSPELSLKSNWKKHKLDFKLGGDIGRYDQTSSEHYEDGWFDAKGRYDVNKQTILFGGFNYTSEHEDQGSPSILGSTPTTYSSRQLHAGFARQFGNYKIRVGGTHETLDYKDTVTANNDDRDREVTGVGFRFSYLHKANREIFMQVIRDDREYDSTTDDNGFNRNSYGYRFAAGIKSKISNRLSAEAHVGTINQYFDDSRFSDVHTFDVNAKIKWLSTPFSQVSLQVERSLEETTLANASSYMANAISLEAKRNLDNRTTVVGIVSGLYADYQDHTLKEALYDAAFEWRYKLSRNAILAASYRLLVSDTNLVNLINNTANPQNPQDYMRQQFTLTYSARLFSNNKSPLPKRVSYEHLKSTQQNWCCFYLGAATIHGAQHTVSEGIRGTSGFDHGEFGDTGPGRGLFLGYGFDFKRWYLGLELEAGSREMQTFHNKNKTIARTMRVKGKDSIALSVRGGKKMTNGSLLYAKIGHAKTKLDTYSTINNATASAFDQDVRVNGIRFGMGTDIPVNRNLFVRMDYSYTNNDKFVADIGTEADTFNTSENVFSLGVGWVFNGENNKTIPVTRIDTNGVYAGIQIGHGSILSDLYGTHNDSGSTPGTYSFVGDFGDNTSLSGALFMGYGHTFNNLYLGFEVEGEASDKKWDHVRLPTGRDFSAELKSTTALGIRAGYKLRNGTLLYVGRSRVRARFVTNWAKGGNRLNDINRDDKVYGKRNVIGAEIPTSKNTFLRTRYAISKYDPYQFTSAHGNPDSMSFNNSDSVYTVGLGVRF